MEEKSEWNDVSFVVGRGEGGGGAKGGEGLGLVAALQMEIERRPANQDESAVHF